MGIVLNNTIDYKAYLKKGGANVNIPNTSSIQLPSIEYGSDTMKGGGIMGEIDMPSPFAVGAMQLEINFRQPDAMMDELTTYGMKELEIRWTIDQFDPISGLNTITLHKVVCKGMPKKNDPGKIESQTKGEGSVALELVYYKKFIDGAEITEIDKFNYIYKSMGKDLTASMRNLL